ncbi:hypothetical protein [Pseudomonas paralactis]|uniref:hypothetical protein n=1 Tax=Pseudomonas paralactis TaxID=1615673 RepID=UPI0016488284|nr:hypothetical protein [Pseudomonas paralactis]
MSNQHLSNLPLTEDLAASESALVAKAHATFQNEAETLLTKATINPDQFVGNFVDAIMAKQYRPRVFHPRRLYGYAKK